MVHIKKLNEMVNAQRSVSYGELAELENMFNDQVEKRHIVFGDTEESTEALFDFIQQYIEGNDNPQVNVGYRESRRANAHGRAVNEMAGGIPNEKDYMIVLWCYYFEQSKEIHNLVTEDDFELLCGDGTEMSLSEYINAIKEFTQKTGLPVEISTPEPNDETAYCGISVNGESVGCFVLTSIRDNKNILRSVIGEGNTIKVG